MSLAKRRPGPGSRASDVEAADAALEAPDHGEKSKTPGRAALVPLTLLAGCALYIALAASSNPPKDRAVDHPAADPSLAAPAAPVAPGEPQGILYPSGHKSPTVDAEIKATYGWTPGGAPDAVLEVYEKPDCTGERLAFSEGDFANGGLSLCTRQWSSGQSLDAFFQEANRGVRVLKKVDVDLYKTCGGVSPEDANGYQSTIMGTDGCTNLWKWPRVMHMKLSRSSVADASYSSVPQETGKLYNVVYSVESAEYFVYQAMVHKHAFSLTGNAERGALTRVVTVSEPDDLMGDYASFTAKRHPYSRRYSPLNKADGMLKWFLSPSAPREPVIVVVDPDNWLTQDLTPIAREVSRGRAVANHAWYDNARGRQLMESLWQHLCEQPGTPACVAQLRAPLSLAAVPYFVHRDDLAALLPRWRRLIVRIKELCEGNDPFKKEFAGLQITWGAEMLAYNFAAAEVGVRHELRHLQVRDVDGQPPKEREKDFFMIHMGRAWVPWDHEPERYGAFTHTEGRDFRNRGRQIWCKANRTSAIVRPWPIPPEGTISFASRVTLTYLHDAYEALGEPPRSKFRKKGLPTGEVGHYHYSYP